MTGLLDLPIEIQYKIFLQVPKSLTPTCRAFVVMENDFYMKTFISKFGDKQLNEIKKDLPYLKDYIKSFDYWRRPIREIISKSLDLVDNDDDLESKYVKDSWKLIYGIYTNRRIYVDNFDYDVVTEGVANSVNIMKQLKLIPGKYNFSVGIIIKGNTALRSTRFDVYDKNGTSLLEYQPPSHIGELIPHDRFALLNVGDFVVKKTELKIEEIGEDDDQAEIENGGDIEEDFSEEVTISVKEMDVLLKSDYIMCFIDINMYSEKNDDLKTTQLEIENEWFAWWVDNQSPKLENVVNTLLKRLYKSINGEVYDVPVNNLDIETYNKIFYSKYNESGDLIERRFGYISPIQRRRYYQMLETKSTVVTDDTFPDEPLRWKINTIL